MLIILHTLFVAFIVCGFNLPRPINRPVYLADGNIPLSTNNGWRPFTIPNGKFRQWSVPSDATLQISVIGATCPGDSFDLYLNDRLVLSTPTVPLGWCPTPYNTIDTILDHGLFSGGNVCLEVKRGDRLRISYRDHVDSNKKAFLRIDNMPEGCLNNPINFIKPQETSSKKLLLI